MADRKRDIYQRENFILEIYKEVILKKESKAEIVEESAMILVPTYKPIAVSNPYDKMIEIALTSEKGLETLEKLIELKERTDANEAKKAYHLAMAHFKENPPEIEKDGRVGYTSKNTGGTTSYNHATLGNVSQKINSGLGKHGLSASWNTEQVEGKIKITCTITHAQGFSESTSLFASADDSGKKNSIQAIGSTITYLQRYTILALTGLATKEQDDDGAGSQQKPEVSNLVKLTPEYKALQETKKLFPVEYDKMVEDCKGDPGTAEQCKMANDYIKALVDKELEPEK